MRLTLQIAAGVFVGTVTAQFVIDEWHSRREQAIAAERQAATAEAERVREQQLGRIQEMFRQQGRPNHPVPGQRPPGRPALPDSRPNVDGGPAP